MDVRVSLVIPAHNEDSNLVQAVKSAREELSQFLGDEYEIIIAEDGSSDNSQEIAGKLDSRFDRTTHQHLKTRKGKGRAINDAINSSSGDIVAFMDADLSTDPSHLEDILKPVMEDRSDITLGSRRVEDSDVERGSTRRLMSWAYNSLADLLLGTGIADHQCGFKAFRRQVFRDLQDEMDSTHWFWDTEFLARASRNEHLIQELPVKWRQSKDSNVNLLNDTLYMTSKLVTTSIKLRLNP